MSLSKAYSLGHKEHQRSDDMYTSFSVVFAILTVRELWTCREEIILLTSPMVPVVKLERALNCPSPSINMTGLTASHTKADTMPSWGKKSA